MNIRHLRFSRALLLNCVLLGGALLTTQRYPFSARAWAQETKPLFGLNAAALSPLKVQTKGDAKISGAGDVPLPWSMNLWDAGSTGEIALEERNGVKAIALRNLDGKGAIQFYNWQPFDLPAGRKITVRVEYAGSGAVEIGGEGVAAKDLELTNTGEWKTLDWSWNQNGNGKLNLNFQNYLVGADKALFLKSVAVLDGGALPVAAVPVIAPVAANATSALPVLKADSVTAAMPKLVVAQVADLKPRLLLLGGNPDSLLSSFERNSVEGQATFSVVDVAGMPFQKAIRIETEKKPQEWMTHLQLFTHEKIHAGDVLYVTAWARLIQRTDGQSQGVGRLYASEERGGNQKDSASIYGADFGIPAKWTRVHFPLVATRDHGADDELKLMFTFGHTSQTVEFGGVTAINFGPNVAKEQLPHAELVLDYPGRDANAPWRKAALARIEKFRKNDLKIIVVDGANHPIKGAKVKVNMTRHAFGFGSSFPFAVLPKEYQDIKPWNDDFKRVAGASDADKARAVQEFLRLFNCTTNGLTWAVWGGADARISQSDIRGGLRWLREHNIPLYNAQSVYPSPEFTDPKVRDELLAKGKKDEFARAVRDYVTLSATQFSPPVRSLQLANEIEGRPQYTDLLGQNSVPDWFKWAKAANPKIETEINGPYCLGDKVQTVGRGTSWPGKDVNGSQFYFDLVSHLQKQGAPIDAIGFQNHTSIGAAGPEQVLQTLDDFARLGKPLEVTEYEMTLQNGRSPQQRAYQADYTRDFFIAVFSHPQTRMIMLQDYWQPAAWQYEGASAFFNADWSPNPHERAYEDLVLNQWWTRETGTTNPQGAFSLRGFKGNYDVEVSSGGYTQTVTTQIGDKAGEVRVVLK